jgi:hypothetical protein
MKLLARPKSIVDVFEFQSPDGLDWLRDIPVPFLGCISLVPPNYNQHKKFASRVHVSEIQIELDSDEHVVLGEKFDVTLDGYQMFGVLPTRLNNFYSRIYTCTVDNVVLTEH